MAEQRYQAVLAVISDGLSVPQAAEIIRPQGLANCRSGRIRAAGRLCRDCRCCRQRGNNHQSAQSEGQKPSAQDLDPTQYQPISPRDYALLVKDPDAAKGRKLIVYGVVTQFDAATGTSEFRASTGAEKAAQRYDYDVNTMIHAPDPAILKNVVEKDFVTMHVEVHDQDTPENASDRATRAGSEQGFRSCADASCRAFRRAKSGANV
ncbi:MAG: hypothetical protein WBZ37_31655 [Mycobacterium sp.]